MQKFFSRLFPSTDAPEPLPPGIYHGMFPEDVESPNRLHLRIEPDGNGLLLLNAATVLHLNPTAAEHIYFWLEGNTEDQAAEAIARRYQVTQAKALKNQREIRDQIISLADVPDLDPVLFIGLDRTEPYSEAPTAPYRLDCALTYRCDSSGSYDPLARARVDAELTTEEWKDILSKAWEFGIPHITFTGGEPCLWDDLPALIAHCEASGQVTGLLTNGVRLAQKSYLSELDQSGLDHILITYDPENDGSKKGLAAALATDIFTAAHLSIDGLDSLVTLDELYRMGVTAVSLSASGEDVETLQEARNHAAAIGLDLIWDLPVPYSSRNPIALELEGKHAGDGRGWLYVEPDGDVLPSQGVDSILGNLLQDPWDVIWEKAQNWYTSQVAGEER